MSINVTVVTSYTARSSELFKQLSGIFISQLNLSFCNRFPGKVALTGPRYSSPNLIIIHLHPKFSLPDPLEQYDVNIPVVIASSDVSNIELVNRLPKGIFAPLPLVPVVWNNVVRQARKLCRSFTAKSDRYPATSHALPFVPLQIGNEYKLYNLRDVSCVSGADNRCVFVLSNGRRLPSSSRLCDYDLWLRYFGFLKVHRSHYVNLMLARSFDKGRPSFLTMKPNIKIPVTPACETEIYSALRIDPDLIRYT